MGFLELVAVSATEMLLDKSLLYPLHPLNKYTLQFTHALIDCVYLYKHNCTLIEDYYGIKRLAPSKKTLLIIYLVERVLQSRHIDILNYLTRLLYVVEVTPYWSLMQSTGRIKFESSTLDTNQSVLVAGALVLLRVQHWLQSNNVIASKSTKIIHPPPPPSNVCINCGKAIIECSALRLSETGQVMHEWCTKDMDVGMRSIKLN